MARHYSPLEKKLVMDRLTANMGDVDLTARQTRVSVRTIARWKQQSVRNGILMPMSLPPMPPVLPNPDNPDEITIDLTPILDLRTQLITLAETLGQSVPEAIPEAPLNQRVAALAYIIDRLVKVNAMLPKEDDDTATTQMEYPITLRPQEDDHENQTEAESDSPQETSDSPAPAPSQPADHS